MEKRRNYSLGAISPLFHNIFDISLNSSPITYKFVKSDCSNYFFLNSENLICRGTDISKCFRESLGIQDNESRLYIGFGMSNVAIFNTFIYLFELFPLLLYNFIFVFSLCSFLLHIFILNSISVYLNRVIFISILYLPFFFFFFFFFFLLLLLLLLFYDSHLYSLFS